MNTYKTALALEQDASASGAQIIALTTRNKALAELSNVVPTNVKQRIYDEVAAATFNDPAFIKLNTRLGLTEKDLRKAAKAKVMVSLYGAGERTGILNIEGKLGKVLGKESNTLVVKAADRDIILGEISARIARYEKFDPVITKELKQLRTNVRDIFNKGLDVSDEIMEQLFFLDANSKGILSKLTQTYDKVVTPNDFKMIGKIMSEHMYAEVPILKSFTRYFGRLAEDFLKHSKPSNSAMDWVSIVKTAIRGSKKKGYTLPDRVSEALGLPAGKPLSEQVLSHFGFWKPNGTLSEIINGIDTPVTRKTGGKYFKVEVTVPSIDFKKASFGKEKTLLELELFYANKLPKSWVNVPSVNFDGKIVEQNFTQVFEERLVYKDKFGNWTTNILQIPQKTEADWWDQVINKSGKINDIADVTKARTAYAVNANHSNDAVIVKKFLQWGKKTNTPAVTVHDAFVTNVADMLKAKEALRKIFAETLESNVIKKTLDEMKDRGLPDHLYRKYLNEAIDIGLIPVPGRSKIGGKVVTIDDILTKEDILKILPKDFKSDLGFYGIG